MPFMGAYGAIAAAALSGLARDPWDDHGMDAILPLLAQDWPWLVALVMAAAAGAAINGQPRKRWQGRHVPRRWRGSSRSHQGRSGPGPIAPAHDLTVFDAAEQLRVVERSPFTRRRLLNTGEARLLRVLEEACAAEAPDWRVMAQVSLGEILASPDKDAYRAINSKRVDLLLVGADGHARHAIELQGSGHHIGPAASRDAVKKEALRRAGIGYAEVVVGDTPADVRALVAKLARWERSGAGAPGATAMGAGLG